MTPILIANRGEIAIRIAKSASTLGYRTTGLYSEDDMRSLHCLWVEEAIPLSGIGPAAYLDQAQIIEIAKRAGAKLIHPGYGFLSESATFATACEEAGLTFIGPRAELLSVLGDKASARELARSLDVPIIPGADCANYKEAIEFYKSLPRGKSMLIKAVSGGGGLGMRIVHNENDIETAFNQCQSEAILAFGDGTLYVEQALSGVRHIEIQMMGDGRTVSHLWERDCSLQRRFQKVVEATPAPGLSDPLRAKLIEAATRLADAVKLDNLTTFEFLVAGPTLDENAPFYFIEANPRLQVEHTITEAVTGIDLVETQIRLARGETLAECGIQPGMPQPKASAIQLRINLEKWTPGKGFSPAAGTLSGYDPPSGDQIRVDGYGAAGYETNPRFDSLLAKLIVYSTRKNDFLGNLKQAIDALNQFELSGVDTNTPFLNALLTHLIEEQPMLHTVLLDRLQIELEPQTAEVDPALAVTAPPVAKVEPDLTPVLAPLPGSIVQILVTEGELVRGKQPLFIIESMKMETVVEATAPGIVRQILATPGELIADHQAILGLEPTNEALTIEFRSESVDLDEIRPDLAEVFARRAAGFDANRPKVVAKRSAKGGRTGRANVLDLCDPGSFTEVGSALIAAQRSRRSVEELIERTPADGLITGFGHVNGALFGKDHSQTRCLIMAYDYTVLAGTQGVLNHKKMDRLLQLADEWETPIVLFAEGGGGRPGDVDYMGVAQLDVMTFSQFAKLSGRMPRISIVNGYCFAGNAALAGAADVIIATKNSSIGMGGPAMIAGGGLGQYHPREVGPAEVQSKNGVIDILVENEAEAVEIAQKYLSYFQGTLTEFTCDDQRKLRHLIPENRRRVYDVHKLIRTLADDGSVLELRPGFGVGIIIALARIEGRPVGLIANNPNHLGGAIDVDGSDKMARFMQLCNAFGLPIVSLVDTPGIMVGPEAEKSGTVRHTARLFVVGASLEVPFLAVILRKGYGLGAQAMCGGSFHVPVTTVAWPTGEFGAMGIEGAVQLGFRKELEAVEEPAERQALFERMVDEAYTNGKALNTASYMELDEVIDPLETRARIIATLDAIPSRKPGPSTARYIDTW